MIVTAGALDTHIHFISPQQIYEAISNGITTMIAGGTRPATGTNPNTCSPGAWNIHHMPDTAEAQPMHFRFLPQSNAPPPHPLSQQKEDEPHHLKLHEY